MALQNSSIFDSFTNQYQLSKTLRFELKPVGKTNDFLKENKVFEKDKLVDDHYHEIKYYFDTLHREFIRETLSDLNIDFSDYYKTFVVYQKNDNDTQKKLKNAEKQLRQTIVDKFNAKADEWKKTKYKDIDLKKDGIEILFEKDNLEILKYEFKERPAKNAPDIEVKNSEGETENLFDSFKGFTTYFNNFNNSRRNFYSAESKDTAVANRAIDENLRRFCQNVKNFKDNEVKYKKIDFTAEENKIFEINFYNKCMIQSGIDRYNAIIGRKADKESEKGINQKINECCQKNKIKLDTFKKLDKQILSDKDVQLKIVEITSDDKVFEILREFIKLNGDKIETARGLFADFFDHSDKFSLDKIYIKGVSLNTISSKWFSLWNTINENSKLPDFISFAKLKEVLESKNDIKPEDLFRENVLKDINIGKTHYETFIEIWKNELENNSKKYQDAKNGAEKMIVADNIYQKDEKQNETIKSYADATLAVYQMMKYFALEKGRKNVELKEGSDANFYNIFNEIVSDWQVNVYYNEFRNYLTKKDFLGRLLFPVLGGQDDREQRHPLLKRKIDGAEKIKLNFENGTLLNGWDKNKEPDNTAIILINNSNFYLVILSQDSKYCFDKEKNKKLFQSADNKNLWQKMEYKFLSDASKMIPKCTTQIKEVKAHFNNMETVFSLFKKDTFIQPLRISKAIFELNNVLYDKNDITKITKDSKNGIKTFKKEFLCLSGNEKKYKKALVDWIEFCKTFLNSYASCAAFDYSSLKPTEDYQSLDEFYRDVDKLSYAVNFVSVNFNEIEILQQAGEIYLFQIYNRDFAEKKSGKDNIHTLYFKALFDAKNLENPVLKLSGGAEIFFRPKNEHLSKKKDKKGKEMVFIDKRDQDKEKKVLQHRRYANDKVFLHLSIIQNFRKEKIKNDANAMKGYAKKFNADVNKNIINKDINIIGIDRGENNLAYYSVINQDDKIIDTGSFNKIEIKNKDGNVVKTVDYVKLLREKAGERDEARKNWQTIANIKELKNGYVSQVIRKICDLILRHNAIVVFEDLNIGFKRSRGALDFPVYQKLELALVKKLNYLVNKDAEPNEAGHYLAGYQLAPMVANPKDIGKQTGIVFYTQAGYTSKTCPNCGFRKNNNKFYFENIEKTKQILEKIKSLQYDAKINRFKLEYKASDFWSDEEKKNNKKERSNILFTDKERKDNFVVYSDVIRYKWHDKNTERGKIFVAGESEYNRDDAQDEKKTKRGIVKRYDITKCLIGLFESDEAKKYNINYQSDDLFEQMKTQELSADFYKKLFHYLNLIFEIRNSILGSDVDYIQCPACSFDSQTKKFQNFDWNGDANGAYNIARKGIMILEKIRQFKKLNNGDLEKIEWGDLFISIEEWDKFAQDRWNP